MMKFGERQVAPTRDGIRRDHVARYEWAAATLPAASRVIDFACGIGYGTQILAEAGHKARGYDNDPDALCYADRHYARSGTQFVAGDGNTPDNLPEVDAAVCFETIEHLQDPRPLLKALRGVAPRLLASVPNEDVIPWQRADGTTTAFHYRHYTQRQFEALLAACGWGVIEWHGQEGPESEVEPNVKGRTLIAVCQHGDAILADVIASVQLGATAVATGTDTIRLTATEPGLLSVEASVGCTATIVSTALVAVTKGSREIRVRATAYGSGEPQAAGTLGVAEWIELLVEGTQVPELRDALRRQGYVVTRTTILQTRQSAMSGAEREPRVAADIMFSCNVRRGRIVDSWLDEVVLKTPVV